MKDSLQFLLSSFPYFLNKNETSNFFKSQSVTNARFQDLYQSLFEVIESLKLRKRILVWREQTEDYEYVINFVANFPHLKSVTILKNDLEIYSTSFTYDEDRSHFDYSYTGNTLNDTGNDYSIVIPEDTFKIIVETYDEYIITKGYPENDEILENDYDHDVSLDEIGALNNIPRKRYVIVEPDFYPATEQPYNNRLTEDDYHYMQRILEYNIRLHNTPLPVLELWKLFGVETTMENRDRLLMKMFDLTKHPNFIDDTADGDKWFSGTLKEDRTIEEWTPQPWEHQDKLCYYTKKKSIFFLVNASTNTPPQGQPVDLTFCVLDTFGHDISENYTYTVKIGDVIVQAGITNTTFRLDPEYLTENIIIVTVECYDENGNLVKTVDIELQIRGCDSADWFVSPDGSDTNTGRSINSPFKTIQKACNSVMAEKNLINLMDGEYTITSPVQVGESCTLICCGDVTVENTTSNVFFKVPVNSSLGIIDVNLKHLITCNVEHDLFSNHNSSEELDVVLYPIVRKGFFHINDSGDLILTLEDGLENTFSISNSGDLITTKEGYSINNNGDIIFTI